MKREILSFGLVLALAGITRAADDAAATNAYLDGVTAVAAGKYADAEKSLSRAIELNEENAAYYQARGVARTLSENFTGAISDFQRAGKLAPSRDWENEAWLATVNKMNNSLNNPFTPGAAPRVDQPYAIALNDLAQNYWQSRNRGSYYDSAQRRTVQTNRPYKGDFEKVAALYSQRHMGAGGGADTKTLLTRAQAQLEEGHAVQALDAVDAMLEKSPGDADVLVLKGKILLGLRNLEGARSVFTDALIRRPSAVAYAGRARAAALMGDGMAASKATAEQIRLGGADSPEVIRLMPQSFSSAALPPDKVQGLWENLEAQCRAGAPNAILADLASRIVRAMAAQRIRYDERYQERLATLEANLKSKPNDPDCMAALARFLQDEVTVLEEHVGPRAEPKPYRVQSAADMKRDLERSNALIEAALKQNPNNLPALAIKAHVQIQAAKYDDAQATVTTALAQKKDDPDLLECLASLLQIQAARKISAAGNLRLPRTWYETHFDEYPPAEYKYTVYPSPAELRQASALERQAAELAKVAEQRLEQAATGAGPTAMGWYYRATLQRVRGDAAGARESMAKAVALQPDFARGWFQLAGILTELRDGEGAVAERAKAYNLSQTTASAELNAMWYKIPHNQFKSAREIAGEGVKLDAADPRLPAYLAVVDEATEKRDDALGHYRMAKALSDANLELRGTSFGVVAQTTAVQEKLSLKAEDAAFPAIIRLRIAALLFDAGKPAEAAAEFSTVSSALAAFPANDPKRPPADALLPSADLPAGMVPIAESIGFLQIRANAGVSFTRWATGRSPADADFAAKLYRRMMVTYLVTGENLESMKAIADLGTAELFVRSRQFPQATEAMRSTPAVPQDFWQEMRQTEAAVRAGR